MHYTSESYTRGECLSEGVSVTAPVFYEDIVRFESIQVHFFYHCEGETITIVFGGIVAKTGTEECHKMVIEYVIAMNFERENAPEWTIIRKAQTIRSIGHRHE
jgi:hypothetical protein